MRQEKEIKSIKIGKRVNTFLYLEEFLLGKPKKINRKKKHTNNERIQ